MRRPPPKFPPRRVWMNRRVSVANTCSLALLALMAALPAACAADFKIEKLIVGETLGGRPIECNVYGDGDDVFWLIATIHGNEAAGTPIAKKFVEWLEKNPKQVEGRKIVVMPVANPDGFADNVRFNRNG